MATQIKALIQFRGGPITVAEYMSEVLTNPTAGYYSRQEAFGERGDFITSPEVSQIFGEMVGIWCITVWQQLGMPEQLRLIELGPGRGTLMADLLRGTQFLKPFQGALQVHLVEVSESMRARQRRALGCEDAVSESRHVSAFGPEVQWHRSHEEVPQDCPAIVVANEFFDALPVHQFQKTDRGWSEVLVDIANDEGLLHLRNVLAPGPTPASRLLLPPRLDSLHQGASADGEEVTQLEICPQGIATAEALAKRIASRSGAVLAVDYGQDGPYPASLQAIRQHKAADPLSQPGLSDLSAWVDFSSLRQGVDAARVPVSCHGPVMQGYFLQSLGIEARLEALERQADEAQATSLREGVQKLVEPGSTRQGGMGESYKAWAMLAGCKDVPAGFLHSAGPFE
ncbi:hypothetical protein WJX74_004410 [Apatococcus lobatus]|uniref:Protein arginine methyltransferase NDUFAF7 n=1 Tax=Apatococcus lobatus TaxID=904363 RepID=A0AAW1QWY4_9CHLO